MNNRERALRAVTFKGPDRIPIEFKELGFADLAFISLRKSKYWKPSKEGAG